MDTDASTLTPAARGRFSRFPRWFLVAVLAVSFVGAGTRVAMVFFVHQPSQPGFLVDYDPIFYSQQANLVADGHGFIAPYLLDANGNGPHRPSAGHPPLLVVVLAVATRLGARSFGKHRLVVALIGALIVPLLALLGAELGGWRTGVIAGTIAAVYPNLWLYDGLLMPEALAGVLIALALLVSLRLQRSGRTSYAVWLGVIIGLAALTRGELLLLVPLLALPVCIMRRDDKMRARLRLVGVATLTAALVISPWVIYNFARFQKPVLISTAEETTLGGANCNPVYYGAAIGAWNDSCFTDITSKPIEESVAASEIRTRVEHYVEHHKSRLALVALARIGRTWDVFKPGDNVTLGVLQRRPRFWSWFALAMYAALVPAAVAGAFVLRRRRVSITPLVAMPVLVTVTSVLFWGNPRFRRPAELAIVVFAAVALDAFANRVAPTRAPSPTGATPDPIPIGSSPAQSTSSSAPG